MKKWKKNKYKNALDKSESAQAPLNTVHGRVNGFPNFRATKRKMAKQSENTRKIRNQKPTTSGEA